MSTTHIFFDPLVPIWLLVLATGLAALLIGLARGRGGLLGWRLFPLSLLLLALANPHISVADGVPLRDIAVVVVDETASMGAGDRLTQSRAALTALTEQLRGLADLDVRIEYCRSQGDRDEGTRLFAALERGLADVPRSRLAGAVMITDGQVHDVPDHLALGAPLHGLLAGRKNERDRRLVIEQAPGYGVVGGPVSLSFHIEDPGQDGVAELSIRRDGGAPSTVVVPLNRSTRMDFPLEHAGVNSLELTAAAVPGELTLANNHAAVVVHGIRDRLRVLLVSGEPHAGERIWRNLLKADPSVDLVHFTILRPPEKNDRTPLKDLALIAFPVRELFEEKLKEFDLIIFDRFRIRNILPESYYRNISEYVKSGGALLVSVGPEFAGPESLSNSALASILPAVPDGQILAQAFLPQLSPVGRRHPVTSGLPGAETDPPQWGRWVRQIGGQVKAGAVLMETPAGKPLLLLDRPGDGRVALLLSDSSWLWTRGWEGGGPQAELLRRTAHWLMHEPDLEEEQLSAEVVGQRLKVVRRSLQAGNAEVKMAAPDGTTRALALTDQGDGRSIGETILDQVGLWRITDGRGVALAVLGSLNPLEMSDLRATADKLQPVVTETGGGLRWLVDGLPALRRTEPDGPQSGAGWIGLRANHQTVITTVRDLPLLPGWLLLLAGLGSLVLAWWREGR